jgi:hypothetical protein
MVQNTSFDIEHTKDLYLQLTQLRDFLNSEWRNISSQSRNLRLTWHDPQSDQFDQYYTRNIEAPYADVVSELDGYIAFLDKQITTAEEIKRKLGNL